MSSPFNITDVFRRCYAVMDPYSAIPTRCNLPHAHEGPHQSLGTTYPASVEWEWENEDE